MEIALMDVQNTSWQERYHASEIFTLRCRVLDKPGMFGTLITAIGKVGAQLGTISVVGIDSQNKIRDITVYCSDKKHLQDILDTSNGIDGIKAPDCFEIEEKLQEQRHTGFS